jgi:hypothetical protein
MGIDELLADAELEVGAVLVARRLDAGALKARNSRGSSSRWMPCP